VGIDVESNTGAKTRTQDASAQEVHLLDLLIVILMRRKAILLFSVTTTILTMIVVLILPNRFTAVTVVLPPASQNATGAAMLSQLAGSGGLAAAAGAGLGIKNPGEIYLSLFHSRTLEDAIVRRFGLMSRYRAKTLLAARRALDGHTAMVLGAKDGLITIGVTDKDPNEAAAIANGYVEEFRKFSANLALTEASQRRAFFQQQLLEANENLAAAEDAMKMTEQATGVLQMDSQTRALIESASALRAQVIAKEVQIQGMQAFATNDNPEVLGAKHQLAALQSQLDKLMGTDQDSSTGLLVTKGNVPGAQVQYVRKLRDVKYYETISELIAKQFEAAKLDEARQGTSIQVVDLAVPPEKKSGPVRRVIVLVALMISLVSASMYCLVAAGLQRMNSSQNNRQRLDALRAALGMRNRTANLQARKRRD
jgi:uncharacterized protein involved in exopolysaccharide biosynthesis